MSTFLLAGCRPESEPVAPIETPTPRARALPTTWPKNRGALGGIAKAVAKVEGRIRASVCGYCAEPITMQEDARGVFVTVRHRCKGDRYG